MRSTVRAKELLVTRVSRLFEVSAAVIALLASAALAGEGKIEVKLSVEPAELRVPAKGSFSFTVSLDVKNSGDAAVRVVPPSPDMIEIRDGAGGQLKLAFKGSDASRTLSPSDFPELAPGASVALKLSGYVFESGKLSLTAPTGGWWEASPSPAPGKLIFSAVYSNDKASMKLDGTLVENIWTGSLKSIEAVATLVRGEVGLVQPELVLQGRTSLINDVTLLVVNSDEEWRQAMKLCFCSAGVRHQASESRFDHAKGKLEPSGEISLHVEAESPCSLARASAVFILPGRKETGSPWVELGRCVEKDGLLTVEYEVRQPAEVDKAVANPSPFCIAFIPKTSKPVALVTGGKTVATVGAGQGGDAVNGLQLRLKAARTQYRLSAKEPLKLTVAIVNVSGKELSIIKRRSHGEMSVFAGRRSRVADGAITKLLPPEPPGPVSGDDVRRLAPGEEDLSEDGGCEMLVRINEQMKAGNGRAGVYDVEAGYSTATVSVGNMADGKLVFWRGSLRSNAARVSLIPEETWTRLEATRKSPEAFRLSLRYSGPQEQPEPYAMFVHEKAAPKFQPGFVAPPTGISTAEILRVVDALVMNEKLWHTGAIQRRRAVAEPGYELTVSWGEQGNEYIVDARAMGVGLDASACLSEINAALDAAHRRPIDMILGRLAVHRVIAEKEAQKGATAAPATPPSVEPRPKSSDELEAF